MRGNDAEIVAYRLVSIDVKAQNIIVCSTVKRVFRTARIDQRTKQIEASRDSHRLSSRTDKLHSVCKQRRMEITDVGLVKAFAK